MTVHSGRWWTGRSGLAAASASGAFVIAALAYLVSGTFNPSVSGANPLGPHPDKYCVVSTAHASSTGWTLGDIKGIANIGAPFFARNGISTWMNAGGNNNNCQWRAELDYSDGTWTDLNSNDDAVTLPYAGTCWATSHVAAFCVAGTHGYWYVDGVQVATGTVKANLLNLPTTMILGELGSGNFPYGAVNPLDRICIAGPSGTASSDPTVAIANTCGQFTNTVPALNPFWSCYGCLGVAPDLLATPILAVGDSITANGLGVPRPWPAKLNQLLGHTYTVTSGGVAGNTVAQMKTRYEASWHTPGMFSRCLFLGGINDIIRDGATGAATYATAAALLDEMRTDGCAPVVVKPTPAGNSLTFGWTSGRQTQYEAYRTSLAGYCVTNSLTCVETYTDMGDGASPVQLKSNLDYQDHIHPNQAGMDQLAQTVFAGVTW